MIEQRIRQAHEQCKSHVVENFPNEDVQFLKPCKDVDEKRGARFVTDLISLMCFYCKKGVTVASHSISGFELLCDRCGKVWPPQPIPLYEEEHNMVLAVLKEWNAQRPVIVDRDATSEVQPTRVLPAELHGCVFRHLTLPLLVSIGPAAFQSLDREDRVNMALRTGGEDVSALFKRGAFGILMARYVIERHIYSSGGQLTQAQCVPESHEEWRRVLDEGVLHGLPNKLLVSMLQHGVTGHRALIVAARSGRFDTVRALYHNDWYGDMNLTLSVRDSCLQKDDVAFLKWLFSPGVRKKDPNFAGDLYSWLLSCVEFDAVKCFAYLRHERGTVCCESVVTEAIKVIDNCRAVRSKHLDDTRRYADYFYQRCHGYDEVGKYRFTTMRTAVQHMRRRKAVLYANDDAEKCGKRWVLPHVDMDRAWSKWQ